LRAAALQPLPARPPAWLPACCQWMAPPPPHLWVELQELPEADVVDHLHTMTHTTIA